MALDSVNVRLFEPGKDDGRPSITIAEVEEWNELVGEIHKVLNSNEWLSPAIIIDQHTYDLGKRAMAVATEGRVFYFVEPFLTFAGHPVYLIDDMEGFCVVDRVR